MLRNKKRKRIETLVVTRTTKKNKQVKNPLDILILPEELLLEIFGYLTITEMVACTLISKKFREVIDFLIKKLKVVDISAMKKKSFEIKKYFRPNVIYVYNNIEWNELIDKTIYSHRETVLANVNHNGIRLMHVNKELQEDYEIVMTAVKQNGLALEFAHHSMRENKEVVIAAVKQQVIALNFAGDYMKKDIDVVFTAIIQRVKNRP